MRSTSIATSSEKYPRLFSPIKVGTQTVKNRLWMPPVSTNLAVAAAYALAREL